MATKLARFGVRSILFYSVEADIASQEEAKTAANTPRIAAVSRHNEPVVSDDVERHYETNADVFCHCVDAVAETTADSEGIAAIKLTALVRPRLLFRLSEGILATSAASEVIGGCSEITATIER